MRIDEHMKLISIIMAVFNEEEYVREAIESILNQSFSDFEFIIIDDCSTDQTLMILQEYAQRDERIRLLQNKENRGLTASLNKGIRAAHGEYIARMDADDISHPKRLELQVAFLEKHSDCGVVGSWYIKINEQRKELWRKSIFGGHERLRATLIRSNPLPHASLMFRREALEQIGLYNESWKTSQDYELLFRISKAWKIEVVPAFLLSSRVSSSSVTHTRNRQQVFAALRARIQAIQGGQYPKFAYLYCVPVLFSFVVPISIRQFIRRFI